MSSIRVPYVPTPTGVAVEILKRAGLKPGQILIDAGAGECGVVIAASRVFNAVGIGIEKDPLLVKRCLSRIRSEGLIGRAYVVWGDILKFNYSIADVVYLYLGTDLNRELAPILLKTMRRGAKVVSHDFEIPGWKPVESGEVDGPLRRHKYFIYVI